MNVSMHTNSRCDGLPVKVSAQQIRQLIEGEEPPRLSIWDCFCNFFLDLVCCACGGNRRASEQQLREIFDVLYPQTEEGMPQGGDIQSFMTTLEKLINLTDVPHQGNYHFHVGGPQNGRCQLAVFFGCHHLAEREITVVEKLFLEDYCLCEQDSVQGIYNLRSGMPSERERRECFGGYELVEKCTNEISKHGTRLHARPPSVKLEAAGPFTLAEQEQTLGAFPCFGEFKEKQGKGVGPKLGAAGLQHHYHQMTQLDKSYQDYRDSCTKYNTKTVDDLLQHIYLNNINFVSLKIINRKIGDVLEHICRLGLYSERMNSEFIESTTCFMRVLCSFTEAREKYPEYTARACEELLSILDPGTLAKIPDPLQNRYLVGWCEQLERRVKCFGEERAEAEALRARGSDSETPVGAAGQQEDGQKIPEVDKQEALVGAAGQQEDGQTKSEAAGKKAGSRRWPDWGSIFIKKGKASKGKAPEKETSSLQKQQKELLDNTNKTKEAA